MRRFVTAAVFILPSLLGAPGLPPVAAVARVADSLAQSLDRGDPCHRRRE
jgi:hypothetical protein